MRLLLSWPCLVVEPFVMMIVVLTMKGSIAWNSYIARRHLLCDDFGFVSVHQRASLVWLILVYQVPKPYYLAHLSSMGKMNTPKLKTPHFHFSS